MKNIKSAAKNIASSSSTIATPESQFPTNLLAVVGETVFQLMCSRNLTIQMSSICFYPAESWKGNLTRSMQIGKPKRIKAKIGKTFKSILKDDARSAPTTKDHRREVMQLVISLSSAGYKSGGSTRVGRARKPISGKFTKKLAL